MVAMGIFARHRIITPGAGDHLDVIELLPPLTIGEVDVARFVDAFTSVLDDAYRIGGLMQDFGRTLINQARLR